MVVKKFGVLSAGKVLGALYALLGLIVGAFTALFSLLGAAIGAADAESTEGGGFCTWRGVHRRGFDHFLSALLRDSWWTPLRVSLQLDRGPHRRRQDRIGVV